MPTMPFPDDVRELLAAPNPSTMTTLRSDGAPVSVATWYLLDGDRILLNLDATRVRLRHLRRDPRVALTVLTEGNWYAHVSLTGRVTEIVDDENLHDIDRLARQYGLEQYPDRESPRVSAWMEVERWHGWGTGR